MSPLWTNASTGFSRLRLQEADRRRAASDRQAGILFQSAASHGLRPHHAVASGCDAALAALHARACCRVHASPDGGGNRAASVLAGHRHGRSAPRLALAQSLLCAVEWLPQPVASTTVARCRWGRCGVGCGESPGPVRIAGIDMRATIAAIRSTVLRAVSATDAALVSVMIRRCFPFIPSFPPMPLR